MDSKVAGPVNIGSDELISINNLAKMAMDIAGKNLSVKHIPGPLGVRGRSSDNTYIKEALGWRPATKLIDGMRVTYQWIAGEASKRK
jgi:nucleoside-diphosphate-sugar epimerase